jgi:uncharacterized membrane protein HdeD (DUF308 family)
MYSTPHDPTWVRLSTGLYRSMLRAYPPGFRREYGSLMLQVFRDSCLHAARRAGPSALLAIWGHTLADYLLSLVEQHAQRGAGMTRSTWIKLSGWLMAGGGLLLLFAWFASSRPQYNPYNFAAWPVDRFLNQAVSPSMIAGALFVFLGLTGLLTRYSHQAGKLGIAGLWISLGGALGMLVGIIGLTTNDTGQWWQILMSGVTAMYLGMALFGVACLKRKVLPRWNVLPLLAGLPWLLAILVEVFAEITRRPFDLPESAIAPIFLVSFTSLALIGYRLQADTTSANPPTLA